MAEELLFEENDIINKEYYNVIKGMIKCSICLDIVKDPVQCDKCQHCFCSRCSEPLNSCPFRCKNHNFVPSFICNQLLSELKIKCKCGKEISYDFLKNHKKKDCQIVDYREKYLNLKKEYDSLLNEINQISDHKYCIKSSIHPHPIECNRRFLQTWNCDNCKMNFNDNIPSYQCTLCNFDLCYYCAKNTITKGTIMDKMADYYKEKPLNSEVSRSNINNVLHKHPLEYVKTFTPWICDCCKNEFTINTATFKCTLCDFDLCKNCANIYKSN